MANGKQAQFRKEQLHPRAFEVVIVLAAVASAIIAAIWKAVG